MEAIIAGAVALVLGIITGKFLFAKNTTKKVEEAEAQAAHDGGVEPTKEEDAKE